MKIVLLALLFYVPIIAADSTATLIVNGTTIKIEIPEEFYIDLKDFQKFLDTKIQNFQVNEIIIDDLTGDNLSDTICNKIYLNGDGCIVKSKILSNGALVYSDSAFIFIDEGNDENIWGSDSIYNRLFPYSLLYISYRIRVQAYTIEREYLDENIFMYLGFKKSELEKMGLNKTTIESRLYEAKQYVYNYKGKFINNISLSDPDTFIYEAPSKKFVIYYSP
jgi:hypothetical protein